MTNMIRFIGFSFSFRSRAVPRKCSERSSSRGEDRKLIQQRGIPFTPALSRVGRGEPMRATCSCIRPARRSVAINSVLNRLRSEVKAPPASELSNNQQRAH